MEQYTGKYIGGKKIQEAVLSGEQTPGGVDIIKVTYEDGTVEMFSSLMFLGLPSDEACDLSALRDKRVQPCVQAVLAGMRDWGIKVGETPYFGALLNQSLNFNVEEATKELWSKYMPRPLTLDDVDLVTVDLVLKEMGRREKSESEKEQLIESPYNK